MHIDIITGKKQFTCMIRTDSSSELILHYYNFSWFLRIASRSDIIKE